MKMVKFSRRAKEITGISMLFSAFLLMIGFVVPLVRKRSLSAAVLGVLGVAEGTAGAVLLADAGVQRRARAVAHDAQSQEIELFDGEESRAAAAHIRHVLGGHHEEAAPAPVLRDIPRDEEATEADFQ